MGGAARGERRRLPDRNDQVDVAGDERSGRGGKRLGFALREPDLEADVTAFLEAGRLVEFGETQRLFTAPANERTEAYITGRFG